MASGNVLLLFKTLGELRHFNSGGRQIYEEYEQANIARQ